MDGDLVLRNHAQEIEQVLRVESDFEVGTLVIPGQALFTLSHFDGRREHPHFTVRELHANRAGTFVGELCDALDRAADLVLPQGGGERVIFGENTFVVREVTGQLALLRMRWPIWKNR